MDHSVSLISTIAFGFGLALIWLYRRTWTPKTEILGHFGKGYF